ncbi:hypothetical protein GY21_11525 [Cryobacterium roopkundense]|uniref:N-acetyl-1-D-myo-inositol-2-amino-2-deoxy-alpha-D-glucopyranoside deacetylase n=1 Tax=Cryobacterium roopkundense TaxID=1001240 RepID=A0A099J5K0_9MICO|nr:PIG-L family deacetylase [Cryobacterium roopkundense]KGJ73380.1 hypothetical protein GY21_11525 [Cryobacterium roopkundense]MBB5640113.1 N-acetyl-1-D-myo-inositol-2-amino-2-deoxy-alpha-D-glucopyranoside deacetylase [Cryobacterium roopkundense]
MSVLDGLSSVLFVHAHPDDETISTGALIAELVSRGIRVTLLTATRGERGEVVAGPLSQLEGTQALSDERELELERAVRTLGVAERFWLGEPPARRNTLEPRHYRDSGMSWISPGLAGPANDVSDEALVRAPLGDVTQDIESLLDALRPSLVISYDHGGGYGHPDHVRVHDATVAASRAAGTPFAEIVHVRADASEWFTLDRHEETVLAALRCHASQLTVDGTQIVHSGGQREDVITSVGLRAQAGRPHLP